MQLLLPFGLAEKRKSISNQIQGLEATIHEQTARFLEGGPQEIGAEINRMKAEKEELKRRLRQMEKALP